MSAATPREPETPQTDRLLQAWRGWTMTFPQWEGLQLVREAFVAGWEAAAAPGAALLLDRAKSHNPIGIRLHDGGYDRDDMECASCGEDWPCLVSELAAALGATPDPQAEPEK